MTTEIVMLAVGLVFGGVAVWLIFKGKIQAAADKSRAEGDAERAALTATLQARDSQIQTLSASLEKSSADNGRLQVELTSASTKLAAAEEKNSQIPELNTSLEKTNLENVRLQTELNSESNKRATAEEKNSRIPPLETERSEKASRITELLGEVTALKEAQAGLTTTIDEERKSAAEKLALLNDAQQKLGDAFKALSSDALRSNNQSFLELANATLEKFQQSAQTDLTARQKAIDELVKPLKESLDKVDGKIAAIEKERTSAYSTL